MSADVYSDLTIGLALKNYPKMSPHMLKLIHWIQSYNDISILSADLYIDLIIGLVLKNYPKMIPDTLKSIHWIRSYRDVFFHVS